MLAFVHFFSFFLHSTRVSVLNLDQKRFFVTIIDIWFALYRSNNFLLSILFTEPKVPRVQDICPIMSFV